MEHTITCPGVGFAAEILGKEDVLWASHPSWPPARNGMGDLDE